MAIEIQVEIIGWIARTCAGANGRSRVCLTREAAPGTTVRQVLGELVRDNPTLGEWIYNPATGELGDADAVQVILNDRLITLWPRKLDTPLEAGSELTLVAAFAGGGGAPSSRRCSAPSHRPGDGGRVIGAVQPHPHLVRLELRRCNSVCRCDRLICTIPRWASSDAKRSSVQPLRPASAGGDSQAKAQCP